MTIIAVTITGFTPDEPRVIYSGNWRKGDDLAALEDAVGILQRYIDERKAATPLTIATANSNPIPVPTL